MFEILPADVARSVVTLQVFIRLEGLGEVIRQQLMQARSFSVTQLVTLLQQLKVPTKLSEPVHVELLVKVQSKVMLVHYANESTLNALFKGENRQINGAFVTPGHCDGWAEQVQLLRQAEFFLKS
jgi:hypothetical protein